jgi:hypothetical protein
LNNPSRSSNLSKTSIFEKSVSYGIHSSPSIVSAVPEIHSVVDFLYHSTSKLISNLSFGVEE